MRTIYVLQWSLLACLAACEKLPSGPTTDGWSSRPAEPFALIAELDETAIRVTIAAVDLAGGHRHHVWQAVNAPWTRLRVSPSADRAAAQKGVELVLIDLQNGRATISESAPGPIRDIAFVNDSLVATMVQVATSGIPGRVPWGGLVLFDATSGAVIDSVQTPGGSAAEATVVGGIATSAHHPGRVWSSQPLWQTITAFDAITRTVLGQFELEFQPRALAISADGTELWAHGGGNLFVLDPVNGLVRRSMTISDSTVASAFALSADGNTVYTVHANGYVRRADARSGSLRNEVRLDGTASQVTVLSSGELLVLLERRGQFVGANFFVTGSGQLRTLDGISLTELQRIDAGIRPIAFVIVSRW